jgi:hypothetical protein
MSEKYSYMSTWGVSINGDRTSFFGGPEIGANASHPFIDGISMK